MSKIIRYLSFLKKVNIRQFFYLNYFCRAINRMDKSKIIPYKNVVFEIEKTAKINLCNGDIEIGCDLLKKSKAETRVRIREGSIWNSKGGCKLTYGTTLEILADSKLDSGYFTMNCDSVMVVAHRIVLGNDVMMGRNVIIYDSDYHQILNNQNEIINRPEPVIIGDHVWIATNVMILKGSMIGSESIIGANSLIYGDVEKQKIANTEYKLKIKENIGKWERKSPEVK